MFNICHTKSEAGKAPTETEAGKDRTGVRRKSGSRPKQSENSQPCRLTKLRTFRWAGAAGGVLIKGRRFLAFLREFIIRHIKDRGLNDERSGKQRPVQTIWRQMVKISTAGPKRLCVSPAGRGRDERHGESRERRAMERIWEERLPGYFEKIAG